MARRQPLTFEGVVTPERIFLAFVCALALSAIGVLVWHMLSELSWQPQHQFMISIAMPAHLIGRGVEAHHQTTGHYPLTWDALVRDQLQQQANLQTLMRGIGATTMAFVPGTSGKPPTIAVDGPGGSVRVTGEQVTVSVALVPRGLKRPEWLTLLP